MIGASSYLEVVVLPLLLRLQVEPGQPTQVLLADRLVHLYSRRGTVYRRMSHAVGLKQQGNFPSQLIG